MISLKLYLHNIGGIIASSILKNNIINYNSKKRVLLLLSTSQHQCLDDYGNLLQRDCATHEDKTHNP